MTLLIWFIFLLRSKTVIVTGLLFQVYFFLLMIVFALQWLSLHWEILVMLLTQFSLTFHHINRMRQHHIANDYSCADWGSLHDHVRDVPWEDIFKLIAYAAFMSKFRLELIYISPTESIRSSLTHLHSFQLLVLIYISLTESIRSSLTHLHCFWLLVLLPQLIAITFFHSTRRINLLNLK